MNLIAQVVALQAGLTDTIVIGKMTVVICPECNEPIIDHQAICHKWECSKRFEGQSEQQEQTCQS